MLKLETKKLELGFYPYTYVRASVMRSLLFRKDDYQRMLKMGFNEIAKFLQESHYRNEINRLATEYSGSDLLELALNRNLADSFKKLISISHPNLRILINEYIKRKDIDDIKTVLRGKLTGANEKQILASITSAGTLSYDFLISLLKKAGASPKSGRYGCVPCEFFCRRHRIFPSDTLQSPYDNPPEIFES